MIFGVGDLIAHKTELDDTYLIVKHYYFEGKKDLDLQPQWFYEVLRLSDGCYYKYAEETVTKYSVRIA